jgi:hypothetical protein
MVRPCDMLTAHHQRNQQIAVRPEPFGYAQGRLADRLTRDYLMALKPISVR